MGRDLRPVPLPELALMFQVMSAEFCGIGDQPLVLGIRSSSHVNLSVLDVDHIECTQNSFLTQGGYDAGLGCCSRSPHKDHLMVFIRVRYWFLFGQKLGLGTKNWCPVLKEQGTRMSRVPWISSLQQVVVPSMYL